jgi:chitodextrinase
MKRIVVFISLAAAMLMATVAFAAPLAPENLISTSTSPTTVDLNWASSTGAVGYQIFKNATTTPIATTSNLFYTNAGLTPNTAYVFWITAYDASSTVSAFSSSTSITTQADVTAPATPLNLTAIPVSIIQINLAWSASTDNVAVTGYAVYRGGSQIATTTALSYNDTGLSSTTAYTYNVKAFDAAGNYSTLSSDATATPQTDTAAPSVPTNLALSVISSSQINLSWTVSIDNFGVAKYKIYRNGHLLSTAATNSFSSTGLKASTTYAYQVSAQDAAGNESAKTVVASATTLGKSESTGGNITISIKNGDKKGKLINLSSNEIIKVIVFSNDNYNVKDIDNSTVRFGGAKTISWKFGHANRDRKLDREYGFRAKQMTDLSNADTTVTFTAKLKNGQTITGTAVVRVINSKKKIEKKISEMNNKIEDMKKKIEKKMEKFDLKFEDLRHGTNTASSTWATTTLPYFHATSLAPKFNDKNDDKHEKQNSKGVMDKIKNIFKRK